MRTGKEIAAGILPICPLTKRVLLVKRGPTQSGPNTWASFGGGFEEDKDDNPKDAAKREFYEETFYSGPYKISKLPLYINESNHLKFYTYLGIFDEEFIPDLERAQEGIDYGWFYLDNLPDNLLTGVAEMFKDKIDYIKKKL